MKQLLFLIFLVICVYPAQSVTYHVQPPRRTPYGRGTGLTKADAWNGMPGICWDRIKPFDTITIHGDHFNTGKNFLPFSIKASGIYIKGDARFSRYYFDFDYRNDLLFEGLSFFNSGQFRAKSSKRITVRQCWFSNLDPSNEIFIELGPGNDDWSFDWVLVEDCGCGIYSRFDANSAEPAANRLRITNCLFQRIGTVEHPDSDGHAVGIQEGTGHRLYNVWTIDTGEALSFWARATRPMTDIVIQGCRVRDVHACANTEGNGIVISGSHNVARGLPRKGWRKWIEILDNDIQGCEGNGIRTNVRDFVRIEGNVIADIGREPLFQFNPFAGGR